MDHIRDSGPTYTDDPWLVGGDFNAVRDLNEVCGVSGDIRMAMEEFNAGIQEAGYCHYLCKHEVVGVSMYAVSRKLKALKPVFRQQTRNKGDLALNVQLAKGFLEEAQNLIAQRRAVRRILQINDENSTTHTEPSEVVHEFVSFYQNFLGGNRRQLLVDINYLRPWARHILSNEEASHLFVPFSPEDVKQVIFDIAEDKAPGPDGFSSGFFKAA
ncbi:UNVERIFIED_CONTAM: hypothetical protein Sindi_2019200 [Sesamum indicum]